ncbi:SPI-1 type III secretion system chaperone SpaK [Serratia marcescens]|uniref:InvB/SpaK family type III secretion system chaperone n=1 Tax=Serratia marcescens TaxID=615 RepID=UPI00148CDFA7|nr:SPI-1 type III secretion system chaperone SpaK [Serratia marcescens]QJU42324.1 SPI-1 type III secretion system chaperone SpaK [Serratia marcescens]
MNVDIKSLVSDALLEQGCDESLLNDFDGHSTIALEFTERPDLLISEQDDGVWLWSRIAEDNQSVLGQRGGELLFALMEGCTFTPGGQLQLTIDDGYIFLRGLVKDEYLKNGQQFSAALEEFFILQENFLGIIL